MTASAPPRQKSGQIERKESVLYIPSRPTALHAGTSSAGTPFHERRGAMADRRAAGRVQRYSDIAVALLVLVGVLIASNADNLPRGLQGFLAMRVTVKNVLLLATFCLSWAGSFAALGLYEARAARSRRSEMIRIVAACSIGSIAVLLFPLMTHGTGALKYEDVGLFWGLAVLATVAARTGSQVADRAIRQRVTKRIIIIGTGPRAMELARQLRADTYSNSEILGFVDTREAAEFGGERDCNLGFLDELEQTLMHTVVDEVLIALPIKSHYSQIENSIRACEHAGVRSKYLADVFDPSLSRPRFEVAGNFPLMAMNVVHDDYRLAIKRAFDLLVVVTALPLVAPVFACIALAVKLTSPGAVLFRQERFGLHKRCFWMYKFRTMVTGAEALMSLLESQNEATGPVFKIHNDPRVTPLGWFLRRTSLDELPQLWNVLWGEMSLVGPRPLAVRDVKLFSEASLMRRFSVQPGLTCLWQVSGRSNLEFAKWVELDLAYIDHWSLRLDAVILAKTIPAVLRGTGAA
ncbi:MAG: sugar transferase [Gemmatimonadaceae bacterium]